MSGHSRWAQIKHKKAVSDAKKGQLFSKMVREITVAVRSGGPQQEANPRLRQAVEKARSIGLPKDNVERAIERSSGKSSEALQEFLCEATAPGGVMILIEGITDNKNRALAEIKHLLAEHGAKLAEQGSLIWNFDKMGLVGVIPEDNPSLKIDDLELAAIEAGAEDIKKTENTLWVETSFQKKEGVIKNLEGHGIKIQESSYDYQPRTALILEQDKKEAVEVLLDKLSDQEDVQEVYTNIQEG